MKSVIFAVLVLQVSFGCAQDFNKPITYTTKAVPMRIAAAELSKQGGVKLQVASELEEEPIILRITGTPLQQVMDKIADAAAADWVDHHGYWQLERSPEKVAAIKQNLFAKRVQAFKASVDALVELEASNPPLDQAQADKIFQQAAIWMKNPNQRDAVTRRQQYVLESQFPSMRLALKVLAKMNVQELAAIPINRRVVFSTSPTGMQRPLPTIDPEDMTLFLQQRKMMQDAAAKAKIEFGFGNDFGLQEDSQQITGKPARMVMTTQALGFGSDLMLTFNLYDDKGAPIAFDNETLGTTWTETFDQRMQRAKQIKDTQKDGYALGPIAMELASRTMHNSSELRPVSKDALDVLLHPTSIDPLAIATSDTLLIGAEKTGLQVVAMPEDGVEEWALESAASGKTSIERLQGYLPYTQSEMSIDDGWLVIKPKDPLFQSEIRVPRPALEEFLQNSVQSGSGTIEEAAKLLAACSRDVSVGLPSAELNDVVNDSSNYLFGQTPNDGLRFYGTLTDQRRDSAKQSALAFRLDELSQDQKEMIGDMVYEAQWIGDKNPPRPTSVGYMYVTPEQTELFPNGLPMTTKITVKDTFQDAVYTTMQSPTGGTYTYPQPLENISYSLVQAEHPELYKGPPGNNAVGWRMGKMRVLDIDVDLDGRYYVEQAVNQNHLPDGPPMNAKDFIDSLPNDVRQKIQDQISSIEQSMSKYANEHGGGSTTPPPTSGTPPPSSSRL